MGPNNLSLKFLMAYFEVHSYERVGTCILVLFTIYASDTFNMHAHFIPIIVRCRKRDARILFGPW